MPSKLKFDSQRSPGSVVVLQDNKMLGMIVHMRKSTTEHTHRYLPLDLEHSGFTPMGKSYQDVKTQVIEYFEGDRAKQNS